MDGSSINRCLVKIHKTEKGKSVVYKTRNMHATEKRDLFFFSDPPHLIKTVRNCWPSSHRCLWVCICSHYADCVNTRFL